MDSKHHQSESLLDQSQVTFGNLKFDGKTKPFASKRDTTYQHNNTSEKKKKQEPCKYVMQLCNNYEQDKQKYNLQ